ncbi:unnamed protein product [Calypogeia fissa]
MKSAKAFIKQLIHTNGKPLDNNSFEPNSPPGLTKGDQLNDYVWELYSPEGVQADLEIIFFHGLQLGDYKEAFWKTWSSVDDEDVIWPKDWLTKKIPKARILCVTYDAHAKHGGTQDLYGLAESLVDNIILAEKHKIGQDCPVFLVGHCLGGTVIKQLLLFARQKRDFGLETEGMTRIDKFLGNVKGAFYYATPGLGSSIADLAKLLTSTDPVLQLLKALDTEKARTNEQFRKLQKKLKAPVPVWGVAEGVPTHYLGFYGMIVPEASARQDVDNYYTNGRADHFTVCKARNMRDSVIELLVRFINQEQRNEDKKTNGDRVVSDSVHRSP